TRVVGKTRGPGGRYGLHQNAGALERSGREHDRLGSQSQIAAVPPAENSGHPVAVGLEPEDLALLQQARAVPAQRGLQAHSNAVVLAAFLAEKSLASAPVQNIRQSRRRQGRVTDDGG